MYLEIGMETGNDRNIVKCARWRQAENAVRNGAERSRQIIDFSEKVFMQMVSADGDEHEPKRVRLHAYRVTAVHKLKGPDKYKRLVYCR